MPTITGTQGNDSLYGSDGDDLIDGLAGDDYLQGYGGNDTLIGGDGDDYIEDGTGLGTLDGGAGNDYLYSNGGTAVLKGGDGNDRIVIQNATALSCDAGDGDDTVVTWGSTLVAASLMGGAGTDLITWGANTTLTGSSFNAAASGFEQMQFDGGGGISGDNDANVFDFSGIEVVGERGVSLQGLGGDDTLTGTVSADTLEGGEGSDTLFGGDGDDRLYGGDGNDVLNGGNGNDMLMGDAGDDTLNGDAGDDYLTSWAGSDVLNGGAGNDIINCQNCTADLVLNGGAGDDTLYGGSGNDTLIDSGGNNLLDSGAGNDVIQVSGGTCMVFAGSGDDTIQISNATILAWDAGDGNDTVSLSGTTIAAASLTGSAGTDLLQLGWEVTLTGASFSAGSSGFEQLENTAPNRVYGDNGDNNFDFSGFAMVGSRGITLWGLDGNDTLTGTSLNDTLAGGNGNDTLIGGDGDDELIGDDWSWGNPADDVLYGGNGNDILFGVNGTNILDGGAGDDTLYGGVDNDTLIGGDGSDTIVDYSGVDTINGGAGNDQITGNAAATAVFADSYADCTITRHADGKITVVTKTEGTDTLSGVGTLRFADRALATSTLPITPDTGNDGDDTFTYTLSEQSYSALTSIDGGAGNDTLVLDLSQLGHSLTTVWWAASYLGVDATTAVASLNPDEMGLDPNGQYVGHFDTTLSFSNIENLTVTGSDYSDNIWWGQGSNTFLAGAGDDLFAPEATGNNVYDGGDGNDTLDYQYAQLAGGGISLNLGLTGPQAVGNGTITLTSVENLTGGAGNDTLTGTDGNNILNGGAGDDVLYSHGGNDILNGGDGNDFIQVQGGTGSVTGGAGDDRIETIYGATLASCDAGDGNDTVYLGGGSVVTASLNGGPGFDALHINGPVTLVGVSFNAASLGFEQMQLDQVSLVDGDNGSNTIDFSDAVGPNGVLLRGNGGDDVLIGTSNNDTIWGSGPGGTDNDTLYGGAGDDTLWGGAGNCLLDGGDGNDYLNSMGNSTLIGGAGNDSLGGHDGNTSLYGGDGDDTLGCNNGGAIIDGGDGNDTIVANDLGTPSGVITLLGGAGNDTISTFWKNVALCDAGDGDDTVLLSNDSTIAAASLQGGAGTDLLVLSWNTTLTGPAFSAASSGFEQLQITDISRVLGDNGDNSFDFSGFTMVGSNGIDLNGLDGNDTLIGTSLNDRLDGGLGDDTLIGGGGNDMLIDNGGVSVLSGGDGDDTISVQHGTVLSCDAGDGNDWVTLDQNVTANTASLKGGAGLDVLSLGWQVTLQGASFSAASSGFEEVAQSGTVNSVYGDSGDNNFDFSGFAVIGSNGLQLSGLDGNDTLTGTLLNDSLWGGAGNDTLNGGDGDDMLQGDDWNTGGGDDVLYGGNGNDTLYGAGGNDRMDGGTGTDTLVGGTGDDYLIGSATSTAVFADAYSDCTVTRNADGTITVKTKTEGTDTLSGFGNLQFADQAVASSNVRYNVVGTPGDDTFAYTITGQNIGIPASIDGAGGNDRMVLDLSQLGHDLTTVWWAASYLGTDTTHTIASLNPDEIGLDANGQYVQHFDTALTFSNIENITITGSDYSDNIWWAQGDNTFLAGAGDDYFAPEETGNNVYDGGSGTDTLSYEYSLAASGISLSLAATGAQTVGNGTITISNVENLTGSPNDDTLAGNSGDNTLNGLAGIDTAVFTQKFAQYTIAYNDDGSISVAGPDGHDTLIAIEKLQFADRAVQIGTSGNDSLSGTAGNDILYGFAGDDTLSGGAGNDTLYGGAGNDLLMGGTGSNTLDGGDGNDTASYADSRRGVVVSLSPVGGLNCGWFDVDTLVNVENLTGSSHADILAGDAGGNVLAGGGGNDILIGGGGADTLDGGAGNDIAVFSGKYRQYSITRTADGYTVSGPDTTATVTNIERLLFDDRVVKLAKGAIDSVYDSAPWYGSIGGLVSGTSLLTSLAHTDATAGSLTSLVAGT